MSRRAWGWKRVIGAVITVGVVWFLLASCRATAPEIYLDNMKLIDDGGDSPALVLTNSGKIVLCNFGVRLRVPTAKFTFQLSVSRAGSWGANFEPLSKIETPITYGVWGYDLERGPRALHLVWIASTRRGKEVLYSRSADEGRTWSEPERVDGLGPGQRRLPRVCAGDNGVTVVWLERGRLMSAHKVVTGWKRVDLHKIVKEFIQIHPSAGNRLSVLDSPTNIALACGPQGEVHVVVPLPVKQKGKLVAGMLWLHSPDGKDGWVAEPLGPKQAVSDVYLASTSHGIWLAYCAIKRATLSNPPRVFSTLELMRKEGEANWTAPYVLRKKPSERSGPCLVIDGKTAVLCWEDSKPKPGLYLACSVDGGKIWSEPVRCAEKSHMGATVHDLVLENGKFMVVWCDMQYYLYERIGHI